MKADKILGRIKQFQRMVGFSNENFSSQLGFSSSNLNNYLKGKWVVPSKIVELYQLGLNINWLVSGRGLFGNDSEHGKQLMKELIENHNFDSDDIKKVSNQLYLWIAYNFESLESFAKKTNFPVNELYRMIDMNEISSLKLMKILERNGCNIRWLFSQDNEPYKDNEHGRNLRSILLKGESKNNPLYLSIIEGRKN
jgi:transcriptional regulator with XRE-family HTH domain